MAYAVGYEVLTSILRAKFVCPCGYQASRLLLLGKGKLSSGDTYLNASKGAKMLNATKGTKMVNSPNLFSHATSELSQDALICWLLEWAAPEHAGENRELHACGTDLINAFFDKNQQAHPLIL